MQGDDWLERLNNAVDYLEDNLEGDASADAAARVACASPFHFQRMFQLFSGHTLGQYVRHRRLWRAAERLRDGDPVGVVAVRYGYDSPEAFSRAFRRRYGLPPSEVKGGAATLAPFDRIRIARPRTETPMTFQLIDKGPFRVLGPEIRTTFEDNAQNMTIANLWSKLTQNGELESLVARSAPSVFAPGTTLGVCRPDPGANGPFFYQVGVESRGDASAEYVAREVPAATWAVFEAVGDPSRSVPALFQRVFAEFFPNHPYEQVPGVPDLEVYPGAPLGPDYVCHVWMPVRAKSA